MCFHEYGLAPSQHAVLAATKVLSADALFASPERPVSVRLAGYEGAIYVDLANAQWDVVQITAEGWKVIGNGPVQFWRPMGVEPLPYPKAGGTIADLRPFLNLANQDQWILCVSWLVAALRPDGSFPLLIVEGVHGSGKSTSSKLLRSLLDPNFSPIRTVPRNTRDLRFPPTMHGAWVTTICHLCPTGCPTPFAGSLLGVGFQRANYSPTTARKFSRVGGRFY